MKYVILPLLVLLAVLALVVVGGGVWWARDTAALRGQAETELERRMAELRSEAAERKETFARRHNWPWPAPQPELPPDEALKKAQPEVSRRVNRQFPPSTLESLVQQAEKKYGMYKKGDEVSVRLRGGVGVEPLISGTLYSITEERIQIGRRWFNKQDLPPTELVHFDAELSRQKIQHAVQSRMETFQKSRRAYRKKATREVMATMGYAPRPNTDGKTESGSHWIPVGKTLDLLAEEWLEERRDEVAESVYTEHGFVKFNGRWVRPNPWFRFRRALSRNE